MKGRKKYVKEFENECGYIFGCYGRGVWWIGGGGLNLFAAPVAAKAAVAAGQELIALSVCQPEELGHKQKQKQKFTRTPNKDTHYQKYD